MTGKLLVAALGLALVLEGLMPLLLPDAWRRAFTQLLQLRDGQIRFFGLVSIALGLFIILLAR
ncbi:MAG: DUF2065 domain-containing protein [Ottowia sp.]|nr:DUF2065 domain-containing protein [Ottowia sp.]